MPCRDVTRRATFVAALASVAVIAAAVCCAAAAARPADATSELAAGTLPTVSTRAARGTTVGYDRTYKTDLVERLKRPPELVILGGSRAQRFQPSYVKKLTGLSAFNYAFHNCRPEDAYAVSRYLLSRAPGVKLRCVFAVQSTTFSDVPMDAGLLYDSRLSRYFPADLIERQKKALGKVKAHSLLSCNTFNARGYLIENSYDERVAAGQTLDQSLSNYLANLLPRAASTAPVDGDRSRLYFRKLLALYNAHGVEPLIVLMPYHPRVLKAFRAVGWQVKLDRLKTFLRGLHAEYRFRVLDCTELSTFGGDSSAFYDGAHVKTENARRILAYAVRSVPECFR